MSMMSDYVPFMRFTSALHSPNERLPPDNEDVHSSKTVTIKLLIIDIANKCFSCSGTSFPKFPLGVNKIHPSIYLTESLVGLSFAFYTL